MMKKLTNSGLSFFKFFFNSEIFRKLASFTFYIAVISSFTQINLVLVEDISWGGQFNPYTTFQLYLSDILFICVLFFYGLYSSLNAKRIYLTFGNNFSKLAIGVFSLLILISYFISIDTTTSFIWIIQFIKALTIYLIVINRIVSIENLLLLLLYILSVESVIAMCQFIAQSSVGLSILGETEISKEALNIAKVQIGETTLIRPYGTFLHPNILGGILSLGFILAGYLYVSQLKYRKRLLIMQVVLVAGVIISFSRSALLATLISFLLYIAFRRYKVKYQHIKLSLLATIILIAASYITGLLPFILSKLNIFNGVSVTERLQQIKVSIAMMLEYPLGVGIGNYTNAVTTVQSTSSYPWELQPVHNTLLLISNELGILGGITVVVFVIGAFTKLFEPLSGLKGKYKCFPVYLSITILAHLCVLMNFDHYFYTSHTAQTFLALLTGIIIIKLQSLEESRVVID